MANYDVLKVDGTKSGSVELNDAVFAIEPNNSVLFEAINLQRASLRQGTHAVKNRSAVRGGGAGRRVRLAEVPLRDPAEHLAHRAVRGGATRHRARSNERLDFDRFVSHRSIRVYRRAVARRETGHRRRRSCRTAGWRPLRAAARASARASHRGAQ